MPGYINHNGTVLLEDSSFIATSNRSFRYGEGFYITARLANGTISFWDFHEERILAAIEILGFKTQKHFSTQILKEQVLKLCKKNNHPIARVRIAFFQGNGGLFDVSNDFLEYIIETWPLQDKIPRWNSNGLQIGVFSDGIKAVDRFSSIQTNNALVPIMAAKFAKANLWNDALIINQFSNIAESVIGNVFWIQSKQIFTTPLSEGPIDGVMRNCILSKLQVIEKPLSINMLPEIDEMFIASSVRGIQWVQSCNNNLYSNEQIQSIYNSIIIPLFS
jgi:branched-subunit amino acid aminotransferase/4-amino-4-deoxychorismate lyase